MGQVTVSALKVGMTLDAAVFNARGQRLAEAGTVLDERKISLLQSWGIVEVEIQGVAEPSLEEIESQMALAPGLQKLSAEIDDRFHGGEPHEFVLELRRLVKKMALEEPSEEEELR